jgi:hypothetical protein
MSSEWPSSNSPEAEKQKAFFELRSNFYDGEEKSLKDRAERNPQPTEHELHIGAYEEQVEPQMRAALEALYKKGYATESSGFGGIDHPEIQQIDGYFEVDAATEEKIKALGAWVTRTHNDYDDSILTRIEFTAEESDTEKISAKWMEIADVLPVIGPETYSISAPSIEFRDKFLGEDESRRIHIETALKRDLLPKAEREEAETWLKNYLEDKSKK